MAADPLWVNASAGSPSYDANELRQAMALPMLYAGRAVGARQGVRPGGTQLQVSLAGSTITVQPGPYLVDPGLTSTQGPYWCVVPTAENPVGGPLAAADATNPRIDIVVARVYDNDMDSSGLRTSRTEYIAGVPAPTPAQPATPAGALLLATITVPKSGGGAAVVTNVAPYTVATGGTLPVRDKAARDALTPNAYRGLRIYRLDLDREEIFKGGPNNSWWEVGPLFVRKAADTPRANTTAYQADPELALSLEANAVYTVDMVLVYNAPVSSGINLHWAVPAGATVRYSPWGLYGGNTDVGSVRTTASTGFGLALTGGAGGDMTARMVGIVRTTGAGQLSLEWAQNVSNAAATIMRADSYVQAHGVG